MHISLTKSKIRGSCAVLTGILYILLLFFVQGMSLKLPLWNVITVTGIAAAAVISLFLFEFSIPEKIEKGLTFFFLFSAPAVSFMIVEFLQKGFDYVEMGKALLILNYLFYLTVYLFLYLITNRIRTSVITGSIIFLVLGLVNHYMIMMRMSPLQPWDLLAAQTAAYVLPEIKFELDTEILFSLAAVAVLCTLVMQIRYVNRQKKTRLISAGVNIGLIAACITGIFIGLTPDTRGVLLDPWSTLPSSKKDGFAAYFYLNLKQMRAPLPEGYSPQAAEEIVRENQAELSAASTKKKPDIIVIMNESFSDLSVLGDLGTEKQVIPFVSGLKKDTKKGELIVPVFGGGTCNTEYEFLTGNVCSLLRDVQGVYPMQQYVNSSSPSLPFTLKAQGYNTVGIHPAAGKNWKRNIAYPFLGFDEFLTIDDFQDAKYIRSFISDESSYDKVKSVYEAKGDDPLFIFNVTMQNHGGFEKTWDNMPESISFENQEKYPRAAQYISLIHESDKQIQNLVEYFEQQEDPVVVVFFGDHQPSVGKDFFQELADKSGLSPDEKTIAHYKIPFFIWANYDIDEEELGVMSPNYLPSFLLKTAGLQMTDYNKYLLRLHEQLPVLSPIVCMDNKGDQFSLAESLPAYEKLILDYQIVMYNQVFAGSGTKKDLFYLNNSGS